MRVYQFHHARNVRTVTPRPRPCKPEWQPCPPENDMSRSGMINDNRSPFPPTFDAAFQSRLDDLMAWRRDVRRFRPDPVPDMETANADALADYDGERAETYAGLKLAGLRDAPVHLAVFCDHATELGYGLGRRTMPEMLAYSVVGCITALWLAARARGIGLGWVSILDADAVAATLDVDDAWQLIGYLCIGYPIEEHADPELQRHGWQERVDIAPYILKR